MVVDYLPRPGLAAQDKGVPSISNVTLPLNLALKVEDAKSIGNITKTSTDKSPTVIVLTRSKNSATLL